MHRLFLDANVLFTAAQNPHGKAAFLFAHAAPPDDPPSHARWALLSSGYAIEEARRNIAAKAPAAHVEFDALLPRLAVVAQPAAALTPLALPAKDQPICSAALAARATHLLTGDLRDFGPHMNRPGVTAGIVIQTVAEYLVQR